MSGSVSLPADQGSENSVSQGHAEIDLPTFQEDMLPSLRRRRRRFAFLSFTLAVSVACLVGVLKMLGLPTPTTILFLGNDYALDLATPQNAYGWQGLWKLSEALDPNNNNSGRVGIPVRSLDELGEAIQKSRSRNLIVFVSLHGGLGFTDDKKLKDQAALVAGNSSEGDRKEGERTGKDMLFLSSEAGAGKSLFEAIKPPPNSTRNTLLILDATIADADWLHGTFQNHFADQLAKQEEEISEFNAGRKSGRFVVISASDKGERSWVDEASGMSFFAKAVLDVLQQPRGQGAVLTAENLFEEVKERVEKSVSARYNQSQTPVMLPRKTETGSKHPAKEIKLSLTGFSMAKLGSDNQTAAKIPGMSDDLRKAWEKYFDLYLQPAEKGPPPWVYTPELWRLYTDLLLRVDELSRAGYPIKGKNRGDYQPLLKKIADIQKAISNNHPTLKQSPPYSLAMARVARSDDKARLRTADSLSLLGHIKADQNLALFKKECEEKLSPRQEDLAAELHLPWMYTLFAEKFATTDPRTNLSKVPPDLERATKLRILAEEVAMGIAQSTSEGDQSNSYPYGEQMKPWIKDRLEDADKNRRQGEDLLFAGADRSAQARRHLDEAEPIYRKTVDEVINPLRDALQVRDKIFAELPFYASWECRASIGTAHGDNGLKELTKLAEAAQALRAKLSEPIPADGKKKALQLEELKSLTEDAKYHLDRRKRLFLDKLANVQKADLSPGDRLEIEGLLCVPIPDSPTRNEAVAAREKLHRLLRDNRSANPTKVVNDADRSEKLAKAERNLIQTIVAAVDQGSLTPGTCPWQWSVDELKKDLSWTPAQRKNNLDKFDFLRVLDGASVLRLLVDAHPDQMPLLLVEKWRREVAGLLEWESERIYADSWFNEDARDKSRPYPYYERGRIACLADARELDRKQADESTIAAAIPPEFISPASTTQDCYVLGDDSLSLQYRAQLPDVRPLPGWITYYCPHVNDNRQDRRIVEKMAKETTPIALANLKADEKWPQVAFHAYFRGRTFDDNRTIKHLIQPEIASGQYRTTDKAGVAVCADVGLTLPLEGRISIILDYSGSMKDPPKGSETRAKKTIMIDALTKVLTRLGSGPKITIWVFGQDENNHKDTDPVIRRLDGFEDQHLSPALIDRLGEQLDGLTPFAFTPLVRSMIKAKEHLVQIAPKRDEQRNILVITDGMDTLFCKNDGKNDSIGAPPMWEGDKEYNDHWKENSSGVEQIKAALEKHFGRDNSHPIKLNMIFIWAEGEKAKALSQFKIIESFQPPGRMAAVDDANALTKELRNALTVEPMYDVLEILSAQRKEHVPLAAVQQTKRVILPGPNWEAYDPLKGLREYQVRAGDEWSPPFLLRPSDYLILKMQQKNGERIKFSHMSYLDLLEERQPGTITVLRGQSPGGVPSKWRFGLLQAFSPQGAPPEEKFLRLLLSLEKPPADTSPMQLERPALVWFELYRDKPPNLLPSSWQRAIGYPAYTMEVQTPRPPSGELHYQCWWSDELPKPAVTRKVADLRRLDKPIPFRGKTFKVTYCEEPSITIPGLEKNKDGAQRKVRALVIRVQYEKESGPVLAVLSKPDDPDVAYWQHNLYAQAGIAESIFWVWDDKKTLGADIDFLSINDFKNSASTSTTGLQPTRSPSLKDRSDTLLRIDLP